MNTLLWVLQILLAAVFAATGTLKLIKTREQLSDMLGQSIAAVPARLVKPLGLAEVLAAAGLVLPAATGIAPVLTPLAAVGVVAVMLGAIATHARLSEYPKASANVALAAMAVAVACARFAAYA